MDQILNIIELKEYLTKEMLKRGLIFDFNLLYDSNLSKYYEVKDGTIIVSVNKTRPFNKRVVESIIMELFTVDEIKSTDHKSKLNSKDLQRIFDTLNSLFMYVCGNETNDLFFDIDETNSTSIENYSIDYSSIRPKIYINSSNRDNLNYSILEEIVAHVIDYKERGFSDNSKLFYELKSSLFIEKNYKKGMFRGKSINIINSSIKQYHDFINSIEKGKTLIFDDSVNKKIEITEKNIKMLPLFISKYITDGKIKESIYIK